MKILVSVLVGIIIGALASYFLFQVVIDRDRQVMQLAGDIGLTNTLIKRLIESDDPKLRCELASLSSSIVATSENTLERLGEVRFYEPPGTIKFYTEHLNEVKVLVSSNEFKLLEKNCG